jgi:hypothetical protein
MPTHSAEQWSTATKIEACPSPVRPIFDSERSKSGGFGC